MQQYEGTEKIGLTPELKEVLAAWTKWIGDHPDQPAGSAGRGSRVGHRPACSSSTARSRWRRACTAISPSSPPA